MLISTVCATKVFFLLLLIFILRSGLLFGLPCHTSIVYFCLSDSYQASRTITGFICASVLWFSFISFGFYLLVTCGRLSWLALWSTFLTHANPFIFELIISQPFTSYSYYTATVCHCCTLHGPVLSFYVWLLLVVYYYTLSFDSLSLRYCLLIVNDCHIFFYSLCSGYVLLNVMVMYKDMESKEMRRG